MPPKSPGVFAEKMLYLLDNKAEAEKMGEAGRQRIYESFNLEKMTETYYDLYKGLINGKTVVYLNK